MTEGKLKRRCELASACSSPSSTLSPRRRGRRNPTGSVIFSTSAGSIMRECSGRGSRLGMGSRRSPRRRNRTRRALAIIAGFWHTSHTKPVCAEATGHTDGLSSGRILCTTIRAKSSNGMEPISISTTASVRKSNCGSEAFLAEAQHLTNVGSFAWCVSTEEIRWSEQLYRIFEFEPGTPMTFALIGERVHPNDLSLLADMIERAHRAVTDLEYEHRHLMPDGSVKYLT